MSVLVKIYLLKDPRTGYVFYVGATKGELRSRISAHISEANDGIISAGIAYVRKCLIMDIIRSGCKPTIQLLMECEWRCAGEMERHYLDKYNTKGNILLQQPGSCTYSKSRSIYF